jgi:argininosuccinate lyase
MSLIRGRFQKEAAAEVSHYTGSLSFDRWLYHWDIAGSIAHARMLAKQDIISAADSRSIVRGLKAIEKEIMLGKFQFKPELEDIHMNIEARLTEMIGSAGAKLHTARSRNDQVALDLRLFTKQSIQDTLEAIKALQGSLVRLAQAN